MKIAVDKILPNPEQPRRHFDSDELDRLTRSIREHGVLNAVAVERHGEYYVLIDGERRVRAAKAAGLTAIPAVVRPSSNGGNDRLVKALVANLQRVDMSPMEEARAYAKLRAAGVSNTKIAHQVGVSVATIAYRLRLLDLDEEIQDLVEYGHLPVDIRVTEALLCIPDKEARIKLARRCSRPGITIEGIQIAATKVYESLAAEPLRTGTPSLAVAARKAGRPNAGKPPRWDALRQLKKVPAWEVVRQAATTVCENCQLRDIASEAICRDCQAVELIRLLMEAGA